MYLLQLEPLREFILPSGSEACSFIHLARTVARRAERRVVSLMKEEKLNNNILIYLNRLSDLFFVIARIVNKALNKEPERRFNTVGEQQLHVAGEQLPGFK